MSITDRLRAWLMADARFEGLSADQALVVLDALLAVVMMDEQITDDEWTRLRQEIARLPWAWGQGERMEARIEDARLRVERLDAEVRDGRFQAAVAACLPEPELRRDVYAMLLAVAVADGLDESERRGLERFRAAFELDPG